MSATLRLAAGVLTCDRSERRRSNCPDCGRKSWGFVAWIWRRGAVGPGAVVECCACGVTWTLGDAGMVLPRGYGLERGARAEAGR